MDLFAALTYDENKELFGRLGRACGRYDAASLLVYGDAGLAAEHDRYMAAWREVNELRHDLNDARFGVPSPPDLVQRFAATVPTGTGWPVK